MISSTPAYRHQVVEIPPIGPIVVEHQFFSMTCNCCGQENQAPSSFQAILTRGAAAAQTVLGAAFSGFITAGHI